MRIERSGVVMVGVCAVQTGVCTAKEPGPITAVWTAPARNQIDVCQACLNKMVGDGVWKEEVAHEQNQS